MTDIGESVAVALPVQDEKTERKCPACGATWTKTEPTLAQVRTAIRESLAQYADDLRRIEADASLGYRGSVARGTVGNPNKTHYNYEPDIRGECKIGYDVDGFTLMGRTWARIRPDKFGKRWASRLRDMRVLESQMRATLAGRGELAHMKKGKDGFELLVRHFREEAKLFSQGGVVMVIFGRGP